jgi:small-conductance mechanosensitive channel
MQRRGSAGLAMARALIGILLLLAARGGAQAQSAVVGAQTLLKPAPGTDLAPPALPEALAADQVEGFVARLTDGQARALLVVALKEQAPVSETQTAEAPALDALTRLVQHLHTRHEAMEERIRAAFLDLGEIRDHGDRLLRNLTDQEGWPAVGRGALILLALLAAGTLSEGAFRRLTRAGLNRFETVAPRTLAGRIGLFVSRLLFDLLALLVFALSAYLLSFAFFREFDPMRVLVTSAVLIVVVVNVGGVFSHLFFAPRDGALRLLPVSDAVARRLHGFALAFLAVFAFAQGSRTVLGLLGLPEPLLALWRVVIGTVVIAMLLFAFWRNRDAIAQAIRGAEGTGFLASLAPSWYLLAGGYVIFLWLIFIEGILAGGRDGTGPVSLSLGALILLPLIDWLFRRLIRAFAQWRQGSDGEAEGRSMPPLTALQVGILSGLRLLLVAVALILPLELAGIDVLRWVQARTGAAVGDAVVDIAVACFLAYVGWELVSGWIARQIAADEEGPADTPRPGDDEGGTMTAKSRSATLLPLFRTTVLVVLLAMLAMVGLSSLGVNIGPLLAGAGVVGIAVGFGAQALVRDIVAGIFFLIDDAFRIGEYVEIDENLRGEVERLSIRSMQLRHHRGPLLTIPFGQLHSITNHNRDWAIFKQEFPVAYDTDLNQVKKIIKRIGQELLDDPEHGPKLIETLKSQGVFKIEGSSLVVRTKFKCKPREQFVLRRVVFQRVQEEFSKAGIKLARAMVAVEIPPGTTADPAVIAAAAAQAVPQGQTAGASSP